MFLGLDSSTQSLTAVVIDPSNGQIVTQQSIHFGNDLPDYQCPNGFLQDGHHGVVHAPPLMWLDALDLLFHRLASHLDLSRIQMISGSGQQHGSVYLNHRFDEVIGQLNPQCSLAQQIAPTLARSTSPIWMDTSSGTECAEIAESTGGQQAVCQRSGSIATERFTGPQIRRFFKADPHAYQQTARIHLVSSFLASIIAGKSAAIDFGDGAGMNLLNLKQLDWDQVLLDTTAPDLRAKLPSLAPAATVIGHISPYLVHQYGFSPHCRCTLFTGDNPASLVGMGATTPGQIVISLGTSDTFFAAMPTAITDPNGFGHVFGNPAGGFMSLICFRNGSLARESLRDQFDLDWSDFDRYALTTTHPSAGQNLMLPFFGPEITPRYDFTHPILRGSTAFTSGDQPALQVRALLECQFLNIRLHSQWMNTQPTRLRLTGGASHNDGISQIAADVFQAHVERLDISNSAALGAALIAATAAGHSLAHLQHQFCQPAAGSILAPDPSLAAIYQNALACFEKFLLETIAP